MWLPDLSTLICGHLITAQVPIKVHAGATLELADLKQYQVVVLTTSSVAEEVEINAFTHANNICFISAQAPGLFGRIFTDFGDAFQVMDPTGEQPKSSIVQIISNEAEGVVTCPDDSRHGLESGDYVTFHEVQGMVELNGCAAREIKVIGPYSFSIGDTSGMAEYVALLRTTVLLALLPLLLRVSPRVRVLLRAVVSTAFREEKRQHGAT